MSKATRKQKKTGNDLTKTQPIPAEPTRVEPVKANPVHAEPSRLRPVTIEMAKTEPTPARNEPLKPAVPPSPAAKIEAARTEPVKPQASLSQALSTPPVPAEQWKPAATPKTAPKPEVARISLELVRPEAKKVCVAGSFNGWQPEQTPLKSLGNGRWVGNLAVKPGRYEYLFVIDGQWVPDPNAKETVQNPFGGRNSVLTVSE